MSTLQMQLLNEASRPYRAVGLSAYRFARGKLGMDCIFRELIARGLLPTHGRLLDLGCGQGNFFSWLLAARSLYQRGIWDAIWPPPPDFSKMVGVELRDKLVHNGNVALHSLQTPTTSVGLQLGDMTGADVTGFNVITILDALHYLQAEQQQTLIQRIGTALPADGVFITRIGDASAGWPFHLSAVTDKLVLLFHGLRLTLYHRTLSQWIELLASAGLAAIATPMSGNFPTGNIMLVARKN